MYLKEIVRVCGMNSYSSEQGLLAGACEHINGSPGFVKDGKSFDQLCDYQLINKDYAT